MPGSVSLCRPGRRFEVGRVFQAEGWSVEKSGWTGVDNVQIYADHTLVKAWCWEWPHGSRPELPPGLRKTRVKVKVPHYLVGDELKQYVRVALRLAPQRLK